MTWFLLWFISVFICMCINIPHYVNNNVKDIGIGMILIFCPILNIIYSTYIIVKH